MAKKFPLHPKHPERVCWGCDRYCPVGSMACGNGSERTPHPLELLGEDWHEWYGLDEPENAADCGDGRRPAPTAYASGGSTA
ncbi:MAG: DUF3079 domain-containing protein [Candidatus Accumulibacter sp.]|nr:DUF3079 domain-containing protein [Accumulibacter sp.]